MKKETWKPIYDGAYDVSSCGRVRRVALRRGTSRGSIIHPCVRNTGYKMFVPCIDGKRYPAQSVHGTVALAFLGDRPRGHVVNHINGNKTDNRSENLEYTTPRMNSIHSVRLGLSQIGSRHYRAKITEMDAIDIRRRYKYGDGVKLAAEFGISPGMVHLIIHGRNWRHTL